MSEYERISAVGHLAMILLSVLLRLCLISVIVNVIVDLRLLVDFLSDFYPVVFLVGIDPLVSERGILVLPCHSLAITTGQSLVDKFFSEYVLHNP